MNKPTINKAKFCYYCGGRLTPSTRTIDHIIPIARGGPNIKDNRCWACSKCNKEKMDMTLEEFIIYKALKSIYPKSELKERAKALGILLDSNERKLRNKIEKERRKNYGN